MSKKNVIIVIQLIIFLFLCLFIMSMIILGSKTLRYAQGCSDDPYMLVYNLYSYVRYIYSLLTSFLILFLVSTIPTLIILIVIKDDK